MKDLFINKPLFRVLSPFFTGVIVYFLVLLINNYVEEIQEHFLSYELLLCIALSFIIQELSRALLTLYPKIPSNVSPFISWVLRITIPILLCILIVTVFIHIYFKFILGYTVNKEELWVFNSIFSCFTLIYISLYISYQYLHKINAEKLESEILLKEAIHHDFEQFKKGINPDLLQESLESLIVAIQDDSEKAEGLIDHLAEIYRYILSGKSKQLVQQKEELRILGELIQLLNQLPYRQIKLKNQLKSAFLIVPGSLLFIVQKIVKSSIVSDKVMLNITLYEEADALILQYKQSDRINETLEAHSISDLSEIYSVYSKLKIKISNEKELRKIYIPKLITKS